MKHHLPGNLVLLLLAMVCVLMAGCTKDEPETQAETEVASTMEESASEDTVKEVTGDFQETEKNNDGYQLVDPSELMFSIRDFYYEGVSTDEGTKPTGGEVGKLICEGHEIELQSPEFEGGFIVTKNYGKIKIRFGSSVSGATSFAIWLTPEQKSKFKELKGQ